MPSLTFNEVQLYSKWKSNIFIETGTYMGDTINNMLHHFNKLYSIELSEMYMKNAVKRFENVSNVTIIHGDSSSLLEPLSKNINDSVFFWLDGHWSGGNTAKGNLDCPLLEEIQVINDHYKNDCIIAIDDVRLFGKSLNENWSKITRENILNIVKDRLFSCEFFPSELHVEDRMVLHLKST